MSAQRHTATSQAPQCSTARNRTGDSFFVWEGNVLIVNILGKPAASKDAIGKPKGSQLKVSVTAAPKDGKATDHMVRIHGPTKLPAVFTQASFDL